jgi:predicted nucleic acid-binding OB-fold protein
MTASFKFNNKNKRKQNHRQHQWHPYIVEVGKKTVVLLSQTLRQRVVDVLFKIDIRYGKISGRFVVTHCITFSARAQMHIQEVHQ